MTMPNVFTMLASMMILVSISVFLNLNFLTKNKPVVYQFSPIVTVTEPIFTVNDSMKKAKEFNNKETNVELFEEECLALTMYYEAASQGLRSMLSVGFVVENRRLKPEWPDSYCSVTFDPSQFQTMRKYKPFRIVDKSPEWKAYNNALILADNLINNDAWHKYDSPVKDAIYFHSLDNPYDWKYASSHQYIKTIGKIHFFK